LSFESPVRASLDAGRLFGNPAGPASRSSQDEWRLIMRSNSSLKLLTLMAAAFVSVALGGPAAAQQAFGASGDAPEAAIGGDRQWGTSAVVFTAWSSDFDLWAGTEGPYNLDTAARTCSAGFCGWGAGVQVPSGAQILGVELSACDDDATEQLNFWLIRGPKVPGPVTLLGPITGTGSTPGCATFTATLPTPHTVQNNVEGYALIVTSTPGTNVEWTQFRLIYRLPLHFPN
jgi:hypothetical protein